MKYGHDGYPQKEHEKCSSPVKESRYLGVQLKFYGQNKNFGLFPYVNLLCKTKNVWQFVKCQDKNLKLWICDFYI